MLEDTAESGQAHLNLARDDGPTRTGPSADESQEARATTQSRIGPIQSRCRLYTMGDIAGAMKHIVRLSVSKAILPAHIISSLLKRTNQQADAVQEPYACSSRAAQGPILLGTPCLSVGRQEPCSRHQMVGFRAAETSGCSGAGKGLQNSSNRSTASQTIPWRARAILMAFQDFRREIGSNFPIFGQGGRRKRRIALLRQGQWQEAIPVLIREAYGLGEPAQTQLQALYEEGIEGQWPAYDPRILSYFKTTAAEGLPRPRIMLARIYVKGWGVAQDLNKAMSLLNGNQEDEAQAC